MKLVVEIELDNAAFGDKGNRAGREVSRILREYAKGIEFEGVEDMSALRVRLIDANGNIVGGSRISKRGRVRMK